MDVNWDHMISLIWDFPGFCTNGMTLGIKILWIMYDIFVYMIDTDKFIHNIYIVWNNPNCISDMGIRIYNVCLSIECPLMAKHSIN